MLIRVIRVIASNILAVFVVILHHISIHMLLNRQVNKLCQFKTTMCITFHDLPCFFLPNKYEFNRFNLHLYITFARNISAT